VRNLLYIPIIHTEADLGNPGAAVDKRSASLCGERRWAQHKETVARFWTSISEYLLSLDAANLKIYQDGLAADGELGRRIIEGAAKRGSINHQLILSLLNRGAEVRKTEDAALLVKEYEWISKIAQAASPEEISLIHRQYETQKARLMKERDQFVAGRINETLCEGEVGVLFMGAYHDVLSRLAPDIGVVQLKEQKRVVAYFRELISGHDESKYQLLADYLASDTVLPEARKPSAKM